MYNFFYTTNISVDHAHQVIFHAKVGKGGINENKAAVDLTQLYTFLLDWRQSLKHFSSTCHFIYLELVSL